MDMDAVEGKGILEITCDILDWAIIIIIRREFTTNIYLLFARREVRIGRNCARGLEYGPRWYSKTVPGVLSTQETCLFFSSVEHFVSSFCVEFSLQPFSKLVYACV